MMSVSLLAAAVYHVDLCVRLPSLWVFLCLSLTTCSLQDLLLCTSPYCYDLINLLVHFLSPFLIPPNSNSGAFVTSVIYTVTLCVRLYSLYMVSGFIVNLQLCSSIRNFSFTL